MTVYTWIELLSELVASAKEIPDFRAALPPGFAAREDLKRSSSRAWSNAWNTCVTMATPTT